MERVVRVSEELLVLFEPAIRCRPRNVDVAVHLRLALGLDRDLVGRERVAGETSRLVHEHRPLAVDEQRVARERAHAPGPWLHVHDAFGRLEAQAARSPRAERAGARRETHRSIMPARPNPGEGVPAPRAKRPPMGVNIVGLGLLVAGIIFLIVGGVVWWILGVICLIGGVGALFMTYQRRRRAA